MSFGTYVVSRLNTKSKSVSSYTRVSGKRLILPNNVDKRSETVDPRPVSRESKISIPTSPCH